VKLEIYNLLGQKVATLVDEYQEAGQKTVNWEAKDFSSGIYFYKLSASDFTATKKMVLTK
ncbi:MAG: T9SS type A sorting domain-containing protein, partial [Candidatus Zixiibacteriota bacterium]